MKTECRVCRGKTIQKGFLFKCKKKSCGAVFWHRKVLFEDLENDIIFKVQDNKNKQIETVQIIKESLSDQSVEYRRTEFVGPKVGSELVNAGIIAVIFSLIGILIYIWIRFQWNFALGAIIALIHDVILTLGFFSVLQLEFNLATVAAVLTIAG